MQDKIQICGSNRETAPLLYTLAFLSVVSLLLSSFLNHICFPFLFSTPVTSVCCSLAALPSLLLLSTY